MMSETSNSEFFNEIKEWSERKLKLLENYLASATKILGSIDRVYYVDGFAGRGTYGLPGEPQTPGSPLRAAELARKYKSENKPYSLFCVNIENDLQTFQGLKNATEGYEDIVTNLYGSFAQNVDRILGIIGNSPAICFLDPFGVDGMDMAAIQKLIQRRGITDFWIRFETGEVRRRDGWFNKQEAGAEKQFDILCRVYGIADKEQLHQLLSGGTPEARRDKALSLYQEQLIKQFRKFKQQGYAESYRIGSLAGENKYHLVFATAGPKGIILASNIVYGIEEVYQKELEWYRLQTTGQTSLFSFLDPTGEELFQSKVNAIQRELHSKCGGKQQYLRQK